MIGPGAMDIHHHPGVGAAGNFVEQDGRDTIADLRERAGRGSEVRLELDLVVDAQKLALLLEHREKFTEVLVAFHRLVP